MPLPERILAVDDDPVGLDLISEILGDFDLRIATSGQSGIEAARDFRPDLILLDITMPDIDGYEACRQLRRSPELRHTKVVLVSGRSNVDDRLRGYQAGADDYVTKPYIPGELAAKVRVMLRLKRSEELSQLKENILMLLAHETRTPLTVINGAVHALLSNLESGTARPREFVEMISDAARRLGTLLERSHLLCSLKSGERPLARESVDVDDLLRSMTDFAGGAGQARGIHIELRCNTHARLQADRDLLQTALSPILENAVCHSPDGATVRVDAALDHDGRAVITIFDSGPGMDEAAASQLFEEFSTRDLAHHSRGTGIGLSISREVIRLHGGTVHVDSRPGAGTTVVVSLPCTPRCPVTPGAG